MNKRKIVVIGNGMVSYHFCKALRAIDTTSHIVVYGEEKEHAYDRVHLSEAFAGKSGDDLALSTRTWYEDNHITLRTGSPVESIDTTAHNVTIRGGFTEKFDILVLATGSAPFVPPVPGKDLPGVFLYRTLEDVAAIKAWAPGCQRGTVIGGGLLGLEAAKALVDLGIPATEVLEFAPRLMPRQLDDTGATMLAAAIAKLGVTARVNARTQAFTPSAGKVSAVRFEDGSESPTDIVVISAGIRPRDELARSGGIEVGPRGGIAVDDHMQTSVPGIYAIGECALHKGMIHGLVAPGYRMAETAAAHITGGAKPFLGYNASTLLKLLGVDVASIGDPFLAGPEYEDAVVLAPSRGLYKKVVVETATGQLKGAILVGDKTDFGRFSGMVASGMHVGSDPTALLASAGSGVAMEMPDETTICSCNNISLGTIKEAIAGGCNTLGAIKKKTTACTGCGSCTTEVDKILKKELAKQGVAVSNHLCEHFPMSRTELYQLVKATGILDFTTLVAKHGKGLGCEVCKPTAASIFASVGVKHVLRHGHGELQDTNDKFLANIQKNGTYSVVPRIPGGEITPEKLLVIGEVARDFSLYTKITGGQRIDLFGARLEQLPTIWKRLIDAGFESGHAYAKALRTVKSCVGSTWCRFGVQDSVGMAITMEERYKGIRAPHKIKMAVSGCARECAEAQGKDVGVIATERGYNLWVCGNGGANPRHADLLASDLDPQELLLLVDRFIAYYIRTADRLQRTSKWCDELPGGVEHLKEVLMADKFGICKDLETEMDAIVAAYQCEWKTALEDPELVRRFRTYLDFQDGDPNIQLRMVRGQLVPQEA